MAKSGFWLRGGRGKLAGAALQKGANGETIIREIVTPANPQTDAQMVQRVIMNTVAQAYSAMKEICDHSFEGVTKGAKTMAVFMSRNNNAVRARLANLIQEGFELDSIYSFCPSGMKQLCPQPYILSEGSLPSVPVRLSDGTAEGPEITDMWVTGIPGNTYRDVINGLNLVRGDQLTFMFLKKQSSGNVVFSFCRVILDPTNADGSQASLDVPFISGNTINLPSLRNEGVAEVSAWAFADGHIVVTPATGKDLYQGCVIVSRKTGDTWLRSKAQLEVNEEIAYSQQGFYSIQTCIDYATSGDISLISSRFLNNAGTGAVANSTAARRMLVNLTLPIFDSEESATITTLTIEKVKKSTTSQDDVNALVGYTNNGDKYVFAYGDSESPKYARSISADADTPSITSPSEGGVALAKVCFWLGGEDHTEAMDELLADAVSLGVPQYNAYLVWLN